MTFINSSLVAMFIKLSGYLIDPSNFHISSLIKLSSWFNISNNKLILSSSKGIIYSSSFFAFFFNSIFSFFLFSSISFFKLLIFVSTVRYIIVSSVLPLFFLTDNFMTSSSNVGNITLIFSYSSFSLSSDIDISNVWFTFFSTSDIWIKSSFFIS